MEEGGGGEEGRDRVVKEKKKNQKYSRRWRMRPSSVDHRRPRGLQTLLGNLLSKSQMTC